MTQEGTNLYATNKDGTGTINYNIGNDLTIEASKDTYLYTEKTSTKHAGISIGTKIDNNISPNGLTSAIDIGGGNVSNKIKSTTYNNVDIIANDINIKTSNDTNIKGANITAKDSIDMDIGNNLNIESLQDTYYATSKNNSWSTSASFNAKGRGDGPKYSGGIGGGGTSINSTTDSQWVNEQTSIIADNNINIKTNNNTNLTGSIIASNSDNLSLNTNSLTYQNLNDFHTSTTKGNGLTTNIGTNSESFFKGIAPNGTTTITIVNSGENKKQDTRATIGNGNIFIANNKDISDLNRDTTTVQETTQDQITGALNGEIKIDNRIFTPDGLVSIYSDVRNAKKNTHIATTGALEETYNLGGKYLNDVVSYVDEKLGDTNSIIGSGLQTLISPVVGTSNLLFESRSYLETKDGIVDNASKATNYYGNGIQNSKENIKEVLNMENSDTVARYNPDSSALADVVESGLGKAFNLIGFGGVSRMSRLEAQDFYDRKDMTNVNNVSHSQGTIIMTGALQYYADRYGANNINPTQNFVFTGPAVNKSQAKNAVRNVGINTKKEGQGFIYEHDEKDPINYLTNINRLPEGLKRFAVDTKNSIYNWLVNSNNSVNNNRKNENKNEKLMDFSKHTFIENDKYNKYLKLDYNNQTPINNNVKRP